MLVPRALPTWYGSGQPQMTPGMAQMVMPQQQGAAQPVFAPTPQGGPVAQIGPDRESAMRQQMLAETMQKDYGGRENVNSPLTAGLYALNQGLGSFLDMKAGESKQKQDAADNKALIDALNSADPMAALGSLDNPAAQQAFIQMKLGQLGPKTEPVDVNNDGKPDFLKDPKGNLSPYPQTAQEAQDAQIALFNATTGRQNELSRANSLAIANIGAQAKANALGAKPLPSPVQTAEDKDIAAIQDARTLQAKTQSWIDTIKTGGVTIGPWSNVKRSLSNATGMAGQNENMLNLLQSDLEGMRNDSLRLNSGVQTEGDAQREWKALFANLTNQEYVMEALGRINELNKRAEAIRLSSINIRRQRNGADAFDPSMLDVNTSGQLGYTKPEGSASSGVIRYDAQGNRVQ